MFLGVFICYGAELNALGFEMHVRPYEQSNTSMLFGVGGVITFKTDYFYLATTLTLDNSQGTTGIKRPNNEYSCPHSDYIIIGEFVEAYGLSIIPSIGIKLIDTKRSDIFIYIGVGASFGSFTHSIVAQSMSTGWTYKQSEKKGKTYLNLDLEIRPVLGIDDIIDLSIGYSYNRGLIGSASFRIL